MPSTTNLLPTEAVVCGYPGSCVCTTPGEMRSCNMAHSQFLATSSGAFPATPPPETILDEAQRLTSSTRKDVYAHPAVNFDRIASLWSVILGCEVTAEQTAACQIAVKLARLIETPGHRDSLVDIAGYARTIEMLEEEVES